MSKVFYEDDAASRRDIVGHWYEDDDVGRPLATDDLELQHAVVDNKDVAPQIYERYFSLHLEAHALRSK